LGALCELDSEAPRQANLRVVEFAVLDDGTEIILHSERGFSFSAHGSGSADFWEHMTDSGIERDVMNVVLQDDVEEPGEGHPWDWLVALLAQAGVVESVEHLRGVPYEVRLAGEVRSRLPE